ncbi:MAG: hypothetical protein KatS3mg093_143 [Candidatus Parcubacteria bacterium]|nr:MAG: hypothetical protein KatS3mg093_143 [Candidatus Parcubacteria bacterium]
MKQLTIIVAVAFLFLPMSQAQVGRSTPPGSSQEVFPSPGMVKESEFFFGGSAYYGVNPPSWSNKGKPIIIGLSFSASSSALKKVAEEETRRFALTLTRNVICLSPSWEAKDKFKSIASGQSQYRWLWLEANIDSLSLAWFHCFNVICFEGSQAKASARVIEINPINPQQEFVIAGVGNHFFGHIHSWTMRMWLEESGGSENFYYFTARMVLRKLTLGDEFKDYLLKNLRR